MSELITPTRLKALVAANVIHHATVIADYGVFRIHVTDGLVEFIVSVRTRGGQTKERLFFSIDAVARFMHDKVHLSTYTICAANFALVARTAKRPDAARRLTAVHAALSHSKWAQQKVQAARDGLVSGSNAVIDADAWATIRAAKQGQRDG